MSYIRPLSNPEGLYIIGVGRGAERGRVEFCCEDSVSLPRHIFHGALERWYKNRDMDVNYRGFSITEVGSPAWTWRLRYDKWPEGRYFDLYPVTLVYICAQNEFRWAKQ